MSWISIYNRPLYSCIVGSAGATAMALDHQPLVWIAITFVGGIIVGSTRKESPLRG